MNTTFDELAAPSENGVRWNDPDSTILFQEEDQGAAAGRHHENGGSIGWTRDWSLLKLLYELVVGIPALAEVQAIRIWFDEPGGNSLQPQLQVDELPGKIRAGLELPLDDSITRWVWQHQRPLILDSEDDLRFPAFADRLRQFGIKFFCAVPLTLANRRIGVLGLAGASREALRSFDLESAGRGLENAAPETKDDDAFEDPEDEAPARESFEGIIGRSSVISSLCKKIKVVAPTGSTVLILGETGAGKERFAQAIHNLSPRRDRPFIKVNCAAIPAGLIESELFGHERGAFTGAVGRRIGRFEMANGGTLFLDEIGDVPLELQPKLLRVLQEQEFERIGSTQTTRVNVRIIAATSRDLPRMVADREFRADLYYRLNVFPLRVPALRERSEDIPMLARHFVKVYSERAGRGVTEVPAESMECLMRYPWPGNVRELQNVIERSVILSPGRVLRLPVADLQPSSEIIEANGGSEHNDPSTLKDMEREHIIRTLAATKWVVGGPRGAGARLGLPRTTLIAKMNKLGISRAQAWSAIAPENGRIQATR